MGVNAVGDINSDGMIRQMTRGQMRGGIGQLGTVVLANVLEASHIIGHDDAQRLHAGKALLQVFAVSLNGGAERPQVHAVRSDTDGAAPPARAEGKNLIEAIEQSGPLLSLNQPFELRQVRCELRFRQPMLEKFERLLANGGVHRNGLKSLASFTHQVHDNLVKSRKILLPVLLYRAGKRRTTGPG